MGDETQRVIGKIDEVISKVGDIAITQAVIQTKQDATYGTVGRIEIQVNKINSRVDSLESTRDKNVATKKTTAKWVGGIVIFIGLVFGVLRMVL